MSLILCDCTRTGIGILLHQELIVRQKRNHVCWVLKVTGTARRVTSRNHFKRFWSLQISAYFRCLMQGQGLRLDLFPVECFYHQWKNTEEQLSILTQILKNAEMFCFTDYPCHLVSTDCLKSLPELDNKEVSEWLLLTRAECKVLEVTVLRIVGVRFGNVGLA